MVDKRSYDFENSVEDNTKYNEFIITFDKWISPEIKRGTQIKKEAKNKNKSDR